MKINPKRLNKKMWQQDLFKTHSFKRCKDGRWEVELRGEPSCERYLHTEDMLPSLKEKIVFLMCMEDGEHRHNLGMKVTDNSLYIDLSENEIRFLWGETHAVYDQTKSATRKDSRASKRKKDTANCA